MEPTAMASKSKWSFIFVNKRFDYGKSFSEAELICEKIIFIIKIINKHLNKYFRGLKKGHHILQNIKVCEPPQAEKSYGPVLSTTLEAEGKGWITGRKLSYSNNATNWEGERANDQVPSMIQKSKFPINSWYIKILKYS